MRIAFVLAASVACQLAPAVAQAPGVQAPECVRVVAASRSDGIGFSHQLRVMNLCPRPVDCDLGVEGDASRQHITVAAGGTGEVAVGVASPVATVVPVGRCTMR